MRRDRQGEDATEGVFTTYKLQSLLDCGIAEGVTSRRELVGRFARRGQSITLHGVEAWFRHVDSNYNLSRDSLSPDHRSYAIPKRRWAALLEIFALGLADLDLDDEAFRRWCFARGNPPEQGDAPEIVGRDAEIRNLLHSWKSAESGRSPALVLIEGTAGVGKSTLLDAGAWELGHRGALVLRGEGVEHEDTPLLPILNLVENARDEMRRIDEEAVETIDRLLLAFVPADVSNGLGTRLKRAFLNLGSRKTVVLIVDDAHWADETTIRFLSLLVDRRSPQGRPVFVVLAVRPDGELAEWTDGLRAAARDATVVPLHGLDSSQSATIVSNRLAATPSNDFCQWIWKRTLGNPFHISQMLDHLHRAGQLDPKRVPIKTDVPPSIAAALDERLGHLSPPTRRLLAFASVVGTTFRVAQLQYLHGKITTKQVIDCLEEAELGGMIAYDRDRFSFSHPLARQAIYDALADSRRAHFHFTISQRLVEQHNPSPLGSLEAANHMLRGRMFADSETLVGVCTEASRLSRRIEAWDQVVRFARAALELDESEDRGLLDPVDRKELERLAGDGLHQSGNPSEAIRYLRRVADAHLKTGNVVEASRAITNTCRIRANYGIDPADQKQDIDALVEAVPTLSSADPPLAAWSLDTVGFHYYYANDLERAEGYNSEALSLLDQSEPSREKALVLIGSGLLSLARAEPASACRRFVEAEAVGRAAGDRGAVRRSLERLAVAQLALGRLEELDATVEVLRALQDDPTQTGEHALVLAAQMTALTLRAQYHRSAKVYAETHGLHNRPGYLPAIGMLHGAQAASLGMSGEFDAAREVVAEDSLWTTHETNHGRRPFTALRRRLSLLINDLEYGDPAKAERIPQDLLLRPSTGERYMGNVSTFGLGLEIAILHRHIDQIRLAMPVVAEAFRRGTVVTFVWPSVCALQLARAAMALDDAPAARTYLPIAYDTVRRLDAPGLIEQAESLADQLGFVTLP